MTPKFFKSPSEFRRWLERYHEKEKELWVGFYKVGSGKPSITWPESVDQALCFGWIDGIRKRFDEVSYITRFSPRQARSPWSEVNIKRVEALIAKGLMRPAGLKAFGAREGRTAGYSYGQKPQQLADEYERKLREHEKAWAFFQAQAPWYRRTASYWVMSAKKEETRLKRLASLIECSEKGETIPPLIRPKKDLKDEKDPK